MKTNQHQQRNEFSPIFQLIVMTLRKSIYSDFKVIWIVMRFEVWVLLKKCSVTGSDLSHGKMAINYLSSDWVMLKLIKARSICSTIDCIVFTFVPLQTHTNTNTTKMVHNSFSWLLDRL